MEYGNDYGRISVIFYITCHVCNKACSCPLKRAGRRFTRVTALQAGIPFICRHNGLSRVTNRFGLMAAAANP